jgi:cell division protein FtsB
MRRLFPLLIVVFAIASLAIFIFGDSGIIAYGRLEHYRESLAANVEALNARHDALEKELTQLKTNRESTIALARSLGLYQQGDRIVQLEGRVEKSEVYAMGDLLRMTPSNGGRSAVVKLIACIVAALLVAAAFILARAPRGRAVGSRGR